MTKRDYMFLSSLLAGERSRAAMTGDLAGVEAIDGVIAEMVKQLLALRSGFDPDRFRLDAGMPFSTGPDGRVFWRVTR